tara:strand:- start:43 stop:402 length:360 start_codon:yes stop_codon:yes gene_type:complete
MWNRRIGCQACVAKSKMSSFLTNKLDKKAPLKRKPLKKESSKRQKKSSIYSVLNKKYLEDHSLCEICCSSYSGEIHHKFAGADRDKYMNDTSTWMALCHFCHKSIHENPKWARENGYLN